MSEEAKPLTPLTPELANKLYNEACGPDASFLAHIACAKHDIEERLFDKSNQTLHKVTEKAMNFKNDVDNYIKPPAATPQGKTPTPDSQHR